MEKFSKLFCESLPTSVEKCKDLDTLRLDILSLLCAWPQSDMYMHSITCIWVTLPHIISEKTFFRTQSTYPVNPVRLLTHIICISVHCWCTDLLFRSPLMCTICGRNVSTWEGTELSVQLNI